MLALGRDCELGSYRPRLHELRAERAAAFGNDETRQRELVEARRLFVQLGAERQVARLDRALAELRV